MSTTVQCNPMPALHQKKSKKPRAFAYNGMPTPFGTDAEVEILCEGIANVATPEHGGVKLSEARNKLIPAHQRIQGGWYEEDHDYVVPFAVFADELLALGRIDISEAVIQAKKDYPHYTRD